MFLKHIQTDNNTESSTIKSIKLYELNGRRIKIIQTPYGYKVKEFKYFSMEKDHDWDHEWDYHFILGLALDKDEMMEAAKEMTEILWLSYVIDCHEDIIIDDKDFEDGAEVFNGF